jgi:hypothetical protein
MPDGKLYLYGSHDQEGEEYSNGAYRVISTPDMKEWAVHDVSFRGQQAPWFSLPGVHVTATAKPQRLMRFILKALLTVSWKECKYRVRKAMRPGPKVPLLYAPDCIEKDGKYYLYFCMEDFSEGVGVSDRPDGPFYNPVRLPCCGIDPAVFIDDGGQA